MAGVKDRIISEIGRAIKQAQVEWCVCGCVCVGTGRWLVLTLDTALLHGLSNLVNGYWPAVLSLLDRTSLDTISALPYATTPLTKGRSWVCLCLNEGQMESYVHALSTHHSILNNYYSSQALLRDPHRAHILLMMIAGLEHLKFTIPMDVPGWIHSEGTGDNISTSTTSSLPSTSTTASLPSSASSYSIDTSCAEALEETCMSVDDGHSMGTSTDSFMDDSDTAIEIQHISKSSRKKRRSRSSSQSSSLTSDDLTPTNRIIPSADLAHTGTVTGPGTVDRVELGHTGAIGRRERAAAIVQRPPQEPSEISCDMFAKEREMEREKREVEREMQRKMRERMEEEERGRVIERERMDEEERRREIERMEKERKERGIKREKREMERKMSERMEEEERRRERMEEERRRERMEEEKRNSDKNTKEISENLEKCLGAEKLLDKSIEKEIQNQENEASGKYIEEKLENSVILRRKTARNPEKRVSFTDSEENIQKSAHSRFSLVGESGKGLEIRDLSDLKDLLSALKDKGLLLPVSVSLDDLFSGLDQTSPMLSERAPPEGQEDPPLHQSITSLTPTTPQNNNNIDIDDSNNNNSTEIEDSAKLSGVGCFTEQSKEQVNIMSGVRWDQLTKIGTEILNEETKGLPIDPLMQINNMEIKNQEKLYGNEILNDPLYSKFGLSQVLQSMGAFKTRKLSYTNFYQHLQTKKQAYKKLYRENKGMPSLYIPIKIDKKDCEDKGSSVGNVPGSTSSIRQNLETGSSVGNVSGYIAPICQNIMPGSSVGNVSGYIAPICQNIMPGSSVGNVSGYIAPICQNLETGSSVGKVSGPVSAIRREEEALRTEVAQGQSNTVVPGHTIDTGLKLRLLKLFSDPDESLYRVFSVREEHSSGRSVCVWVVLSTQAVYVCTPAPRSVHTRHKLPYTHLHTIIVGCNDQWIYLLTKGAIYSECFAESPGILLEVGDEDITHCLMSCLDMAIRRHISSIKAKAKTWQTQHLAPLSTLTKAPAHALGEAPALSSSARKLLNELSKECVENYSNTLLEESLVKVWERGCENCVRGCERDLSPVSCVRNCERSTRKDLSCENNCESSENCVKNCVRGCESCKKLLLDSPGSEGNCVNLVKNCGSSENCVRPENCVKNCERKMDEVCKSSKNCVKNCERSENCVKNCERKDFSSENSGGCVKNCERKKDCVKTLENNSKSSENCVKNCERVVNRERKKDEDCESSARGDCVNNCVESQSSVNNCENSVNNCVNCDQNGCENCKSSVSCVNVDESHLNNCENNCEKVESSQNCEKDESLVNCETVTPQSRPQNCESVKESLITIHNVEYCENGVKSPIESQVSSNHEQNCEKQTICEIVNSPIESVQSPNTSNCENLLQISQKNCEKPSLEPPQNCEKVENCVKNCEKAENRVKNCEKSSLEVPQNCEKVENCVSIKKSVYKNCEKVEFCENFQRSINIEQKSPFTKNPELQNCVKSCEKVENCVKNYENPVNCENLDYPIPSTSFANCENRENCVKSCEKVENCVKNCESQNYPSTSGVNCVKTRENCEIVKRNPKLQHIQSCESNTSQDFSEISEISEISQSFDVSVSQQSFSQSVSQNSLCSQSENSVSQSLSSQSEKSVSESEKSVSQSESHQSLSSQSEKSEYLVGESEKSVSQSEEVEKSVSQSVSHSEQSVSRSESQQSLSSQSEKSEYLVSQSEKSVSEESVSQSENSEQLIGQSEKSEYLVSQSVSHQLESVSQSVSHQLEESLVSQSEYSVSQQSDQSVSQASVNQSVSEQSENSISQASVNQSVSQASISHSDQSLSQQSEKSINKKSQHSEQSVNQSEQLEKSISQASISQSSQQSEASISQQSEGSINQSEVSVSQQLQSSISQGRKIEDPQPMKLSLLNKERDGLMWGGKDRFQNKADVKDQEMPAVIMHPAWEEATIRSWLASLLHLKTIGNVCWWWLVDWEDGSSVGGADAGPLGPAKEGTLMFKPPGLLTPWRPAYFILKAGVLYQFNDARERLPHMIIEASQCVGCLRLPITHRPHAFQLLRKAAPPLLLAASNEDEASLWLQALLAAINTGIHDISERRQVSCRMVLVDSGLMLTQHSNLFLGQPPQKQSQLSQQQSHKSLTPQNEEKTLLSQKQSLTDLKQSNLKDLTVSNLKDLKPLTASMTSLNRIQGSPVKQKKRPVSGNWEGLAGQEDQNAGQICPLRENKSCGSLLSGFPMEPPLTPVKKPHHRRQCSLSKLDSALSSPVRRNSISRLPMSPVKKNLVQSRRENESLVLPMSPAKKNPLPMSPAKKNPVQSKKNESLKCPDSPFKQKKVHNTEERRESEIESIDLQKESKERRESIGLQKESIGLQKESIGLQKESIGLQKEKRKSSASQERESKERRESTGLQKESKESKKRTIILHKAPEKKKLKGTGEVKILTFSSLEHLSSVSLYSECPTTCLLEFECSEAGEISGDWALYFRTSKQLEAFICALTAVWNAVTDRERELPLHRVHNEGVKQFLLEGSQISSNRWNCLHL